MTLRTGKGGRYRYYTCSIKARQGETDLCLKRLYDAIETGRRRSERPGADRAHRRSQGYSGSSAGRCRARPPRWKAQDRRSPQPCSGNSPAPPARACGSTVADIAATTTGAGPAHRGRGWRGPHHGIEGRPAQDARRRLGREIGGWWRSQFCSELAEGVGFEPPERAWRAHPLSLWVRNPPPRAREEIGGGGGIRTHGELAPTPVFKTGALNRSATPPAERDAPRAAQ